MKLPKKKKSYNMQKKKKDPQVAFVDTIFFLSR